jgi:uncharacterized protein (DUF2062 family)
MFTRLKRLLMRCFAYEASPARLAFTCALAIYIAFSPFFGFHTLMVIAAGFLLNLNVPLMILVSYGINNPFTMIPIYLSGYYVGHVVLHSWLGFGIAQANPAWMDAINLFLQTHLGLVEISLWAFLIGGNILGLVLAGIAYSILLPLFIKLATPPYSHKG